MQKSNNDYQIKNIFETQPIISLSSYDRLMSEVKLYTQNLSKHLEHALSDQNKSIKRKRIQLEKQLQYLRQRYSHERAKLTQIEEYFQKNCQSVIRNDMEKWQHNQSFFYQILQKYQYQLQIQSLINQRNREKIALLKQELRQTLKSDIKCQVLDRLQTIQSRKMSKSRQLLSHKSISTKSQSKLTTIKMKTENSELTRPTDKNQSLDLRDKPKRQKLGNLADQPDYLPLVSQKLVRLKTEMSLPSLKKSNLIDTQRIQNDDFNFMKPIGTLKKFKTQESVLPQVIKLFKEHYEKMESSDTNPDWFEKVVFNKRNFDKIIAHLENLLVHSTQKKKYPEHKNKVKDIVAKNLFRLKTQSGSGAKNKAKIDLNQRSLLSVNEKKPTKSQQLIKL